jgi:DNA-binding transcriptional regulator YhcF (GntR family)
MNEFKFENHLTIDKTSATPVYQQLVDGIQAAIRKNLLTEGSQLPSINRLSNYFGISRATVEKSYGDLKNMGIMSSSHGKSFFISATEPTPELKILVLFNQLNAYNKVVYDSFVNCLGSRAEIDFHIYHDSAAHLKHLLKKKQQGYSHYVIIPHFLDEPKAGRHLIDSLPKDKLILLGRNLADISGKFGAVIENFALDIYNALSGIIGQLRKYHTVNLIISSQGDFPREISDGFVRFCNDHRFCYRVLPEVTQGTVRDGEAYVVVADEHMMFLLREINDLNLTTGKHVGVISYNENNAKKLMLNGLTTISTDFKGMGKSAAEMVLTGAMTRIENPSKLILRASV